jgi:hypothetical protein
MNEIDKLIDSILERSFKGMRFGAGGDPGKMPEDNFSDRVQDFFPDKWEEIVSVLRTSHWNSLIDAYPFLEQGAQHYHKLLDLKLMVLNQILDGMGVESAPVGDNSVQYINMGDMYDPTIYIVMGGGTFGQNIWHVGDLGSYIERYLDSDEGEV